MTTDFRHIVMGDILYDIILGYGVVVAIQSLWWPEYETTKILVVFVDWDRTQALDDIKETSKLLTSFVYDEFGFLLNHSSVVRRLYWVPPIINQKKTKHE